MSGRTASPRRVCVSVSEAAWLLGVSRPVLQRLKQRSERLGVAVKLGSFRLQRGRLTPLCNGKAQ